MNTDPHNQILFYVVLILSKYKKLKLTNFAVKPKIDKMLFV